MLFLGAFIMLFFAIDLFRNKAEKAPEFDFADTLRPELYDQSPRQGKENAKAVIYEYADFNCASCKAQQSTIKQIMRKYEAQALRVWKDFPFISESSAKAAIAARCAGKQEKFWEYHDSLFANQGFFDEISLASAAKGLNLNIDHFTKCMEDDKISYLVEQDFREGQALGVDSTPTLVIGDIALVGVSSFEDIEKAIISATK